MVAARPAAKATAGNARSVRDFGPSRRHWLSVLGFRTGDSSWNRDRNDHPQAAACGEGRHCARPGWRIDRWRDRRVHYDSVFQPRSREFSCRLVHLVGNRDRNCSGTCRTNAALHGSRLCRDAPSYLVRACCIGTIIAARARPGTTRLHRARSGSGGLFVHRATRAPNPGPQNALVVAVVRVWSLGWPRSRVRRRVFAWHGGGVGFWLVLDGRGRTYRAGRRANSHRPGPGSGSSGGDAA